MVDFENPKLVNHESNTVIEVNSNPFSIGRGLSCNYVVPNKVVSRIHCILEKDNNSWILADTSTNGTYVNSKLIKGAKSPPLSDGATITLDLDGDNYVFHLTPNRMDDISDEQLNLFADSVLTEVEAFQQNSDNQDHIQLTRDTSMNVENVSNIPASTSHPIYDHIGMTKPDKSHINKKQKTEVATNIATNTDQENHLPDKLEHSTDKEKPPDEKPPKPGKSTKDETKQDNFEVMEDELQCSICSELFVKAVTLNCSHTFCKYCIEMWKKNKSKCPICRTKFTGMTATLVLDNVIEKVIESSSEEIKQRRKELLEERQKLEAPKPPPVPQRDGSRARRSERIAFRDMVTEIGPVIEVSSDSPSSDSLNSNTDSDDTEWREEYDNDEWYDEGVPGAYYGGYGHCFSCGRRGHWANGCPYR